MLTKQQKEELNRRYGKFAVEPVAFLLDVHPDGSPGINVQHAENCKCKACEFIRNACTHE